MRRVEFAINGNVERNGRTRRKHRYAPFAYCETVLGDFEGTELKAQGSLIRPKDIERRFGFPAAVIGAIEQAGEMFWLLDVRGHVEQQGSNSRGRSSYNYSAHRANRAHQADNERRVNLGNTGFALVHPRTYLSDISEKSGVQPIYFDDELGRYSSVVTNRSRNFDLDDHFPEVGFSVSSYTGIPYDITVENRSLGAEAEVSVLEPLSIPAGLVGAMGQLAMGGPWAR